MRILIASGGAAHSNIAVQLGAQFVRGTSIAPTILTVIKHETEYAHGQAVLTQAVDLMALDNHPVSSKVRIGNPAKEIISESAEGSFDLIIVGSRPTHTLLTRLLGSTAEWVVSHAPCPVLIAKGIPAPIRQILLCVSGADSPSRQTLFTSRLVHLLDISRVTVLHVMSQISADPAQEQEWQLHASAAELIQENQPEGLLLQQDLLALAQAPGHVQPRIRHGPVVNEILAEAREGAYDLIIIGAHQTRGWQRFLLDNLAHQIVVQADRPVLIV